MKLFSINPSSVALLVLGASAPALAAGKLDSDKKKVSYAIGQQIAQSFKTQQLDIDTKVLGDSIDDALKGRKPKLTPEEMNQAMERLQGQMQAKMEAAATKSKSEGAAYLEANKKKPDVKVTASGLQYKVVTEGKGATPKKTDTVIAHYRGTFIDGKEFDSSYKRGQPAEFPVTGVIPGWTEALLMMKVGEKIQLTIPGDLAYGPQGRPGIPPNSVLNFEIELVDIKKPETKK